MRKIVHANCLESPLLDEYLKSDSKNTAVLTEFVGMEVCKGHPVKNVCHSMKILCRYPAQVIILKGARQIIRENQAPITPDVRVFIDEEQTRDFAQSCKVIEQARKGNLLAIAPIVEFGRMATAEMERLRKDAIKTLEGIEAVIGTFDPAHLKILRKGYPVSEVLADKMIRDILILSALLIKGHPDTSKVPTARELRNTYIFRYAVCAYLLVLDWLERGGPYKVKPERLRNDLIDMSYAAYATFVDGIISKDMKLSRIYQTAAYFLYTVFK